MRHCFALDLKDDPVLIAEYERWHAPSGVWPEILESIKSAGILALDIYRTGNRLLMVMEVNEDFSFEKKSIADTVNPRVQAWEELMWQFQQPLPWANEGEKWVLMDKIFELK